MMSYTEISLAVLFRNIDKKLGLCYKDDIKICKTFCIFYFPLYACFLPNQIVRDLKTDSMSCASWPLKSLCFFFFSILFFSFAHVNFKCKKYNCMYILHKLFNFLSKYCINSPLILMVFHRLWLRTELIFSTFIYCSLHLQCYCIWRQDLSEGRQLRLNEVIRVEL